VGHEGVPYIQRQARTLDFRLRNFNIPPISTLWDTTRVSVVALRRRVVYRDLAVGGGPRRDQRPRLPSEFLQITGATSWLVENENDSEEDRETEDSCEGRAGRPGNLGEPMS
jgi:hypothetical protein